MNRSEDGQVENVLSNATGFRLQRTAVDMKSKRTLDYDERNTDSKTREIKTDK